MKKIYPNETLNSHCQPEQILMVLMDICLDSVYRQLPFFLNVDDFLIMNTTILMGYKEVTQCHLRNQYRMKLFLHTELGLA